MSNHSKPWTRREFLRTSSSAALLVALPAHLAKHAERHAGARVATDADLANSARLAQHADPASVRALAMAAIDAAKAAGATYADARVTRMVAHDYFAARFYSDDEELGIGVRALVNGAWGFSASPYWELDEAVQLAREAVAQATSNARHGMRKVVELGTYPVASGAWSTPIRIDPLQIPIEEKADFAMSFDGLVPTHLRGRDVRAAMISMKFRREERAVATTDGAYFTQTLHASEGSFRVDVTDTSPNHGERSAAFGRRITRAGAGWERLLDAKLREQIPGLIEEAEELLVARHKPVEIGRYDLACDAMTMANLIDGTLGRATELDRALGYEANAGGTSYLGPDPLTQLGGTLGSNLLSITGDRAQSMGLATVKWDDEGVEPERFPIVSKGALQDYSTTREQAAWLAPWYQKQNRAVRSHGCAVASSALAITQSATPNIAMAPGTDDVGFAELLASIKTGLAVMHGGAVTDFQSRTGMGGGLIREIVNGKIGAVVDGAGFPFDSTQIWKALRAVGGARSSELYPAIEAKGQPEQVLRHSVSAVPGILKDIPVIDTRRKA